MAQIPAAVGPDHPETPERRAPANDRDTHGKRVLSIASAAARLAGLADPEAHAEHVQAAFRLGPAAMGPQISSFGFIPMARALGRSSRPGVR